IRIHRLIHEGKIKVDKLPQVEIDAGLTDDVERKYPFHGKWNFADNQVDASTGTITVRARFDNADRALTPGMFARVQMPVGLKHKALLIPDGAIGTDQGQKFVYVVDDAKKVQYRRVRLGPLFDGMREIEDGLAPTDRVIVEGLQRVRPGIEVNSEEVEMAKPG